MQLVILAGGLASRIRPLSEKIPKSLISVGNRPFIDWQLELIKKAGFDDVLLCVGKFGELIEKHVGNGSNYDLRIKYSFDGPSQLGTGGALFNAHELLDEKFAVIYGDSYLPINYFDIIKRFEDLKCLALMTIFKNNDFYDVSNVEYFNCKIEKYSKVEKTPKMQYLDYGFNILDKSLIMSSDLGDKFDLSDLFTKLVSEGKMCGYEVESRFYEIGSFRGIEDLEKYLEGLHK